MSAFSAYVEVAWMAWLVIPMLVFGVAFFICGLAITWKIKHNVVIKKMNLNPMSLNKRIQSDAATPRRLSERYAHRMNPQVSRKLFP